MKKLSPDKIKELLERIQNGEIISVLATENCVTTGTIYYHIYKTKKEYKPALKIVEPLSYKDYINNQIIRMEQKLIDNFYQEYQIPFVKSEIKRLKRWIKVDRERFPISADVLQ